MSKRRKTKKATTAAPQRKRAARARPSTSDVGQLRRELALIGRELAEARAQQAATADVLKVIGSSALNLQAVFDRLIDSAGRLCRADKASIDLTEGDHFRIVSIFGFPEDYDDFLRTNPIPLSQGSISGRAVLEAKAIHIHDIRADPKYLLVKA